MTEKAADTGEASVADRQVERSVISRQLERVAAFFIAATGAFSLMMHMAFVEYFSSIWLSIVLLGMLFLVSALKPVWCFPREAACYSLFILYMLIQLAWTRDPALAMNTLSPAIGFLLALVLFATLASAFPQGYVVKGALSGALIGAIVYSTSSGFPLSYPEVFSYNAVALGYVFCLFLVLVLGLTIRSRVLIIGLAFVVAGHIVATTSIKANLGLGVAVLASTVFYFRSMATIVYRNLSILAAIAALLLAAILTNPTLSQQIERGSDRVALGVDLLMVRENVAGYGSFGKRQNWQRLGIKGWSENPVFGHGVEAFRSHHSITSHSTPIDLLYNSGLIGFVLFYSVFVITVSRLGRAGNAGERRTEALVFGAIACLVFISLSGVLHYNSFSASILGLSIGLLSRPEAAGSGANILNGKSQAEELLRT